MKLTSLSIHVFLLILLLVAFTGQVRAGETGTITGSVYCDQDKDGTCDCEEDGLKNIHIEIFAGHCGGTALQTIVTNEIGKFTFKHLEPRTYFVMADLEYVCGGRVPTTKTCQKVDLGIGKTVNLVPFGFSEYGQ